MRVSVCELPDNEKSRVMMTMIAGEEFEERRVDPTKESGAMTIPKSRREVEDGRHYHQSTRASHPTPPPMGKSLSAAGIIVIVGGQQAKRLSTAGDDNLVKLRNNKANNNIIDGYKAE